MDRFLNNKIHHHLFDLNHSVGASNSSSGSTTSILTHPAGAGGAGRGHLTSSHTGHSSSARPGPENDALARILMDPYHPTIPLSPQYDRWTIRLPLLTMGPAFAQGAFGRLYRGTYAGLDVAVKLLDVSEADPDKARLTEQVFAQEVMMLATLRHPNIVEFVGACRKQLVWCIVTQYAKGGSVRLSLMKRGGGGVPVKVAVRQALDVARGMEYVHGLGFIHRDLKSDNLLISADKSIKIADFGVARIEVQTEGMTPEMGTYRWMAP